MTESLLGIFAGTAGTARFLTELAFPIAGVGLPIPERLLVGL